MNVRRLKLPLHATDHVTTFTVARNNKEDSLGFEIDGGFPGCPCVYVYHVDEGSDAEEIGLEAGDRILMVNNIEVEGQTLSKVLECMDTFCTLKLSVVRFRGTLHYQYQKVQAQRKWKYDYKHLSVWANSVVNRDKMIGSSKFEQELGLERFIGKYVVEYSDLSGTFQNCHKSIRDVGPLLADLLKAYERMDLTSSDMNASLEGMGNRTRGVMSGEDMVENRQIMAENQMYNTNLSKMNRVLRQNIMEHVNKLESLLAAVSDFQCFEAEFVAIYTRYVSLSYRIMCRRDEERNLRLGKGRKKMFDKYKDGNLRMRYLLQSRHEQFKILKKSIKTLRVKCNLLKHSADSILKNVCRELIVSLNPHRLDENYAKYCIKVPNNQVKPPTAPTKTCQIGKKDAKVPNTEVKTPNESDNSDLSDVIMYVD